MIWVAWARIAAVLAARYAEPSISVVTSSSAAPKGTVSASASAMKPSGAATPSRPERSVAAASTERGMAVA